MVLFRPPGRVTFCSRQKSNQKRLPHVSALRFAPGPLTPVPLRGARHEGASCPSRLARRPASHPPPRHLHSASLTGRGASLRLRCLQAEPERFVAWKTAQRFPLLGTDTISGQGVAVVHATGFLWLLSQHFQAGESPRSGGRTAVSWSGSSRMDAARGPVGHGRPIWTDPETALV